MVSDAVVRKVGYFSDEDYAARELNRHCDFNTVSGMIQTAIDSGVLPADTVHQRVGRWTWLWFKEKPSEIIRRKLFIAGFFWNRRRRCWCHKHAHPDHGHLPRNFDPRWKYETETIGTRELVEKSA